MSSSPTEAVAVGRDRSEVARRAARASRAIGVAVLLGMSWARAREAGELVWGLADFAVAFALWIAGCALQHRALLGGRLRTLAPRGNEAAVLADSSHHVALALILSRAITGARGTELGPALAFAVVGALTWALFIAAFRALTAYSDAEEIAGENAAAALSYAGVGLALAIVIAHAVDGPFMSWRRSFAAYAAAVAASFALYPVRHPSLRGSQLDRAIGQERRLDVAAIEAAAYVATSLLVVGLT